MSFLVPASVDRVETQGGIDIPGFPQDPSKPAGFSADLQCHLKNLSANAKSVHHILDALCCGLDRLEKKIDTNSSQMDERLANIVHHVTGEADEDTMSAWSSMGGMRSPSEFGISSLPRRGGSPFGLNASSFSRGPLFELDSNMRVEENVSEGIFGGVGHGTDNVRNAGDDSHHRLQKESLHVEGGLRDAENDASRVGVGLSTSEKDGDAQLQVDHDAITDDEDPSKQAGGISPRSDRDGTAPQRKSSLDDIDLGVPRAGKILDVCPKPENEEVQAAGVNVGAGKDAMKDVQNQPMPADGQSPPRKSNQDDQSNGSDSVPDSARVDTVSKLGSPTHASLEAGKGRDERELHAFSAQDDSVVSGDSGAKYIARQRWMWAFGRVCQLIRRRKRKQFEIMSDRATDRTIRMGSRVSVVEKRVDEAHQSLLRIDRLRDKSLVHSDDIKALQRKMDDLSGLMGVEDRMRGLVQASKAHVEAVVHDGHNQVEAKIDDVMRRHEARLDDFDDRYVRSGDALVQAEDRIGEIQIESKGVRNAVVELERKLRVDEERLDTLETLKKAHQRRLSELRVQVAGVPTGVLIEPEPEEAEAERMARLLRAAGAATNTLAADLTNLVHESEGNTSATSPEGERGDLQGSRDAIQRLHHISVDAADFARRCDTDGDWNQAEAVRVTVERAGALCAIIEDALSTCDRATRPAARLSVSKRRASSFRGKVDQCDEASSLKNFLCLHGRRDLALKLTAARDALVAIISEQTHVGSVKVDTIRLQAGVKTILERGDAADKLKLRLREVDVHLAELSSSVAGIEGSLKNGSGGDWDGGRGVDQEDLDERLILKADVSWVQRELKRLWDALKVRVVNGVSTLETGAGDNTAESRSRGPKVLREANEGNPEAVGECHTPSSSPNGLLHEPSSFSAAIGPGESGMRAITGNAEHTRRSSFNEGSSLIKDLHRKTARLENQMASKADNDEVTRALSSVGNNLRKIMMSLPTFGEALSNKIEKKDLHTLAALISHGNKGDAQRLSGGAHKADGSSAASTVLASRLNSKFRCLSCDRPLPSLGPPGPPKLCATSVPMGGAGSPQSPQRIVRLKPTSTAEDASLSRQSSFTTPALSPSVAEAGDNIAGWDGSPRTKASTAMMSGEDDILPGPSEAGKDAARRKRLAGGAFNGNSSGSMSGDPSVRLEPIAASAPGEYLAGVMSRYPRMMPPPSRVRTAAGGGGAGIGSRPSSSSSSRF